MIDLTQNYKAFKVNAVNDNKNLPLAAQEYLQEIMLQGSAVRCCTFKDVGNALPVITDDDYINYRLAMLTLPAGFKYVDYNFDSENKVDPSDERGSLKDRGVHTLVLLEVSNDEGNYEFHICGDHDNKDKGLFSRPYACMRPAVSVMPSNAKKTAKPFHLFYFKKNYLIPMLMSQGSIVFYIIDASDDEFAQKKLNEFAGEAMQRKDIGKDYWVSGEIVYSDNFDIFITVEAKFEDSKNKVSS
jgi:hypothetical protein